MSSSKQYSGNPYQTPVKLRTNATRQTEDRSSHKPTMPTLDEDDDRYYEQPKSRTSSVRYDRPSYRERTADIGNPKRTQLVQQPRRFDKWTLLIVVSLIIIVMVGGWWLLTTVSTWWMNWQDDLHFGNPRTFQADQYMNMGDTPSNPMHFIALNLHGVIEIIQIDPLDRKKDAVYVLANVGDEKTPATLSFRDTTGSGRVDVIVTIGEATPYTIVLINNGTTLTPTQPAH